MYMPSAGVVMAYIRRYTAWRARIRSEKCARRTEGELSQKQLDDAGVGLQDAQNVLGVPARGHAS
jgi:uncharacterized protein YjiS (DUF1127 family)